ncbi:hypothetical protein [Desulfomonile tiedjei]|uniref:YtxH domain-containing protein n=1 Tax=Desulfomonile tiedjei (strain ATCC 49306 / DSM 6799 / DCB-1) TaxID=706587 RepID=I4CB90_DESTA|nr:hypothetical protein [Desulfomonile tiedjei]AFM26831.1 hypothetical protein Desti_4194 [Desulfomonile tiedjei DSM 6799]
MIETPIAQEQYGNQGEAVSMPESAGVQWKSEENVAGKIQESVCESGYGSHGTATAGDPGQTCSESRGGSGQSGSGIPDSGVGCSEQSGASPHTQGAWNPGVGPQQTGAMPGQAAQYGPYMYNPGYYENPTFGHPMGGSPQYVHPGMGHHPGCFAHHTGMHWHPQQGPHFGANPGPGFGYAESGRHAGQGEQNYGQFADMVGKALQGQANPQDLLSGLLNLNFSGDQFWKGVIVGSVAALLVSSDSVRQAVTGALGGIFGKAQATTAQSEDKTGENAS